jgi:hypothetical protein
MVLRYIERLLVHTPLLLALGGAAMVFVHTASTQIPAIECLESFVLVWLAYRFFQADRLSDQRMERLIFLTLLFLIFFLIGTPISLIPAAFLCWGYRGTGSFALRKIPFVKNMTIALAWVCSTTALMQPIGVDTWLFYLQDFFLIFGLSLLSDLRDRHSDHPQLRTAAHMLQPKWTWCVSWLTVAIYLLPIETLHCVTGTSTVLILLGWMGYWLLLRLAHRHQSFVLQTLCIDGAIGLCALTKCIQ